MTNAYQYPTGEDLDRMNRFARLALFMFLDGLTLLASLFIAVGLRFDFQMPTAILDGTWQWAPYYVVGSIGIFYVCRLYDGMWRYASVTEAGSIVVASSLTSVYMALIVWIQGPTGFPRSIPLIVLMLNIILVGGCRLSVRIARKFILRNKIAVVQTRSVIFGAGDAGVMVLDDLLKYGDRPIGFLDDDVTKHGQKVRGVPVLGDRDDLLRIVGEHDVNDLIIAMPSAPRHLVREIYQLARKARGLSIRVVPALHDIATGKVQVGGLRPINLADLLGRPPVEMNLQEVAGYLEDRSVIVTGAGGSIGSELCRQIVRFRPDTLILLDHDENAIFDVQYELEMNAPHVKLQSIIADIRDKEKMMRVFDDARPDVVFHAAAHKHVPLMENEPEEAVKTNVFGTENVAEAAQKFGVRRFVLISTDKAVNPTSVMGASKRVGEYIIQSKNGSGNTLFMAVRFGNVLGSRGSVVPLFQQQIEAGGPVTVTDPEMTRYFMTIPEAVQLVIQAAALGKGGEVFVLDMGEPVKIVDLASTLISLHGLEPGRDIDITFTGRRPGEKLYEEILTAEEGTQATQYERIFSARVSPLDAAELARQLERLGTYARRGDRQAVVSQLVELIPTFEPESVRKQKKRRTVEQGRQISEPEGEAVTV